MGVLLVTAPDRLRAVLKNRRIVGAGLTAVDGRGIGSQEVLNLGSGDALTRNILKAGAGQIVDNELRPGGNSGVRVGVQADVRLSLYAHVFARIDLADDGLHHGNVVDADLNVVHSRAVEDIEVDLLGGAVVVGVGHLRVNCQLDLVRVVDLIDALELGIHRSIEADLGNTVFIAGHHEGIEREDTAGVCSAGGLLHPHAVDLMIDREGRVPGGVVAAVARELDDVQLVALGVAQDIRELGAAIHIVALGERDRTDVGIRDKQIAGRCLGLKDPVLRVRGAEERESDLVVVGSFRACDSASDLGPVVLTLAGLVEDLFELGVGQVRDGALIVLVDLLDVDLAIEIRIGNTYDDRLALADDHGDGDRGIGYRDGLTADRIADHREARAVCRDGDRLTDVVLLADGEPGGRVGRLAVGANGLEGDRVTAVDEIRGGVAERHARDWGGSRSVRLVEEERDGPSVGGERRQLAVIHSLLRA